MKLKMSLLTANYKCTANNEIIYAFPKYESLVFRNKIDLDANDCLLFYYRIFFNDKK